MRLIKKIKKEGKFFYLLKEKKAFEIEMLAWWLVGAAILVIGVFAYMILTGKLTGGLNFIKNLFRFGS